MAEHIPTYSYVVEALTAGQRVPIARVLPEATVPTPRAVARALRTQAPCWLLESVPSETSDARYSYLGWSPCAVYETADASALRSVQQTLSDIPTCTVPTLPPFTGGAIGFVSYEARHAFESLPQHARYDMAVPTCAIAMYDTVCVWDHQTACVYVITQALPPPASVALETVWEQACTTLDALAAQICALTELEQQAYAGATDAPLVWTTTVDAAQFTQMVEKTLGHIRAGDIYQANVSVRWHTQTIEDPWQIFDRLQRINPSPYACYAQLGQRAIVSCSPELLVRTRGRHVATRPIAGTRPRGTTPDEDLAQSVELMLSTKERAEHVMLVDLERNDLGRICTPATVRVHELMTLEEYSHVIHIVSHIEGELRAHCTWYDVLAATFPGGTITGCPKIRAMEIIDALEPTARGVYTGSMGWIGYNGDMEMNIAIRTVWIDNGQATVSAGAGIVADSQPVQEYAEVCAKAQALIDALTPATIRVADHHIAQPV
jgi:para-aminobenzoate synthetase component I